MPVFASASFASTVNTSGVPRLTKFYSPIHQSAQTLVEKIYALVSGRPAGLCNFLDAPELEAFLKPPKGGDGEKLRVVYRSYATLYFMFVVDSAESELGILDLIQVSFPSSPSFPMCVCVRAVCTVQGPWTVTVVGTLTGRMVRPPAGVRRVAR